MGFITRIQSKSPESRALYGFWIASVVTGSIALVWLTTVPAKLSNVSSEDAVPIGDLGDVINDAKQQAATVVESTEDVSRETEAEETLSRLIELREKNEATIMATTTEVNSVVEDGATTTDTISPVEADNDVNIVVEEEKEPAKRVILIGTTTTPKTE